MKPEAFRNCTGPQMKLLASILVDGPHIVTPKTRRTVTALARAGLVEHVHYQSTYGVVPPFRPGTVVRASGKAWEAYRKLCASRGPVVRDARNQFGTLDLRGG